MLRTIRTDQLRPGMYVQRLCGSWLDHPFWRGSFLADSAAVARVQASGVQTLVIDNALGIDAEPDAPRYAAGGDASANDVAQDAASTPTAPTAALEDAIPPATGSGGSTVSSFDAEVKQARQLLESGRALVEAKNQGEALIHSTEKALAEHGDKVGADEKTAIETGLAELKTAREGTDPEDIRAKTNTLVQASMKLGEAMYAQQQGDAAAEGQPVPDTEARIARGDDLVASQRQREPAARAGAFHRRDHRLAAPRDRRRRRPRRRSRHGPRRARPACSACSAPPRHRRPASVRSARW